MTLNTHPPDAPADDTAAEWSRLESEAAGLRADNAALREQLTLRDQALDATPTFFVIAEQMAPEPIIVYCNKVVADEHGLRRDELIGRGISTLTQWVSRDLSYVSDMNAALRAGRTFHHESEVARRDGSKFWLGVSIRPIFDRSGRVTHSVSMGADITAKREEIRKKQELQDKLVEEMKERARVVIELQLAQKLESVGRLAAGIAHEINTPIQYLGDSVHFLRSAFDDLDQLLARACDAAARLPESTERQAIELEM